MSGKLKRFLIFATYQYYPGGGMYDCKGSFDTLEEARKYLKENHEDFSYYDNIEIFDLETCDVFDQESYIYNLHEDIVKDD